MATVRTLIGNVKGPKGDTGETGATGAAGAAATIDAGTVNTVAFGQPARVTNVGSQSAAVFNFDIPAGQPGSVGEISGYPVNAITTQPGDFPTPVVGDTIAAIVGKQAKATNDAQTGIQNLNASVANILGDFATVETGANASRAYAVGDYLVKDGQFYKVTAAIAQGNALTVGGNIQATNVGAEVSALNNDLANGLLGKLNATQKQFLSAGASITKQTSAYDVNMIISGSNVSSLITLAFSTNSTIILRPLITELGLSVTSSGLTLTVKNNTQYSLPCGILSLW